MAGLAGCLEGMKRANSKNLAGWVEGPVAKLKSGKRQVLLEDGKLICFIVGEDDIVITKNDIDTVECGQTGSLRVYGKKQLAPAQTSEPESERPGSHGKEYELPAARPYAGHESGPLHITEGEPEQDGGYGG